MLAVPLNDDYAMAKIKVGYNGNKNVKIISVTNGKNWSSPLCFRH